MITSSEQIERELHSLSDPAQATHLARFFKTGPGDYGEGDLFLGIRVPVTRSVVRTYSKGADYDDVRRLTASPHHELRLAGFLLLVDLYSRARRRRDTVEARHAVDLYLSLIERGNNWDLVDVIAPKILGDWLVSYPEERHLLDSLADMHGSLWHQRVAIVSTWTIIRAGEYDDTLRLAEKLVSHSHDLMHKATGWMLREVAKRGGEERITPFLDRHARTMPRTMLRYAIERFPEPLRLHYLNLK